MSTPANFDALRERLKLEAVLIARTGLHVGSGGSGDLDETDMAVLRDAEGLPFIPGSSLKGVMRSTVEALLRASDTVSRGLWACNPLETKAKDRNANACGWHPQGGRSKVDTGGHCAACRLFGSHVLASHVRFSDCMLLDREAGAVITVRDGVAIDRDLRIARGGQKYDFEVVAPGASFDVEVFVDNPEDWLLGLLSVAADQLDAGFAAIGGFTSRGLGRVGFQWRRLERVTACELLEGKAASVLEKNALAAELGRWRMALSERAHGGE